MPSSTSSSEAAALEVPRRALFGASLASAGAALLALGAFELEARRSGFRAEVRDSPELWCDMRELASQLGRKTLALVGSSRFQLGLDPRVLGADIPSLTPVQLAINGSPALPVLGDLARDPDFRGTVLCEVMPQSFFARSILRSRAVPWLAYARERPTAGPIEGRLRRFVQRRVACIQPALDLRVVARRALLRQGLPEPPYFHLRDDRFIEADYTKTDAQALLAFRIKRINERGRPLTPNELDSLLTQIAEWCHEISARGGRVIFVRMISSLALRELEDAAFPRADCWERLLRVSGAPGVYDQDLPAAASLRCPDGSHLDAAQARIFTRALAKNLLDRGLV